MGAESAMTGWQVSQVANLLDMPNRDITRSCYSDRKRGGANILHVADSSWGRRNYSVEDMAWLFLIKLQHEKGYSLPEIAQRMDTSASVEELCGHLDVIAARAEEGYDELRVKCERARVLRCALGADDRGAHAAVERYLEKRLGTGVVDMFRCVLASLVSQECDSDESSVSVGLDTCNAARLRHALDEPGIDLAIELWMGPGAFDRLVGACASPQPNV